MIPSRSGGVACWLGFGASWNSFSLGRNTDGKLGVWRQFSAIAESTSRRDRLPLWSGFTPRSFPHLVNHLPQSNARPQPATRNPQPATRNPQPPTRNPQPAPSLASLASAPHTTRDGCAASPGHPMFSPTAITCGRCCPLQRQIVGRLAVEVSRGQQLLALEAVAPCESSQAVLADCRSVRRSDPASSVHPTPE